MLWKYIVVATHKHTRFRGLSSLPIYCMSEQRTLSAFLRNFFFVIAPKQFIPFTFYCIRSFFFIYVVFPLELGLFARSFVMLRILVSVRLSYHVKTAEWFAPCFEQSKWLYNNNKNNKKNDILSVCTVLTTIYHCREIIPWRCHSDNTKVSTRESTKSIIYRQFLVNWNPCYCCCRCDSYCKAIKGNPFEMNIRRENGMHAHSVS